jgi:hypothetical protein
VNSCSIGNLKVVLCALFCVPGHYLLGRSRRVPYYFCYLLHWSSYFPKIILNT